MTDLISFAEPAMVVLKAWLVLSVPAAALACWLFHNADPRNEASLTVRGRPAA
ncbi:hypothetical protein [Roseomonas haemaphysalidis]|uniref:CcoQ/FixQ family Cbb3-type cytochrome c oxidase assembly chaperone n=1 Tax=Roseomonas haemaphysalidis TaxID=2768162 RepID=A0ABS3KR25_9PROT|nr:hypothetical protein [Roseomonas haemaphysalidis]MBO1079415.1 hypothetical protein [Roseomonas haemaphysalidis]